MPNVSWEDVGGLENVKRELQEVIRMLEFHLICIILVISFLPGYIFFFSPPSSPFTDCAISRGASREV